MKKINNVKKFLAFFILVSIIYSLNFFPKFVGASFNDDILTSVETMPIIIDGNFSSIEDEWTNANSTEGFIDDLPIEIWVCYNKSNSSLYIAISIELEIHPSNEFLGIILASKNSVSFSFEELQRTIPKNSLDGWISNSILIAISSDELDLLDRKSVV